MNRKFSDRIGVTQPVTLIQVDSMNEELQNSIWNVILMILHVEDNPPYLARAVQVIAREFLKTPVDALPDQRYYRHVWLKEFYYALDWYEVYNFLEFLVNNVSSIDGGGSVQLGRWISIFDDVLKRELSGYRFIEGVLAPISSEAEVASIEEAIAEAERTGLNGVRAHLTTSLELLSQRPDPDYRNSIKESVSAVESAANCITGSESGGLKKALSKLSTESEIHGALKEGFEKLYGYSSDEDGIRHAILKEPNVGYDEAKFMVVACSAFVHFLIAKAEAASLLPTK